ncbi:hypothetical protein FF011L_39210 [Roseimaritima multifibrata]|uniref:Uncharacterized protein n=1 Tax=Roseimaritima multifibrata TaxID=1930274 RepID=A0A517MJU0_9BACT|nr:hypothetical protein [Roseimaritima multifibrata]QDS95134.1 hypothetical protein FF011L_39210 [Roseimaritima multifibrata]
MPSVDLLPNVGLLPPPIDQMWTDLLPLQGVRQRAESAGSPGRFFWYDPPWYYVSPQTAASIVMAVDALRVPVAALGCELGENDLGDLMLGHSLVPYRPDRYGLGIKDLMAANVIDLRFARTRDWQGRYAYSDEQMSRWLGLDLAGDEDANPSVPESQSVSAPGWLPEFKDTSLLCRKIEQFHCLQPNARCAVSLGPYRLANELPAVLAAKPDIVILRLDDSDELREERLTSLLLKATEQLSRQSDNTDLWVVPPDAPTPDDCVKMFALGVQAVAIDWWCQPLITQAMQTEGSMDRSSLANPYLAQAEELLRTPFERVAGLIQSCGADHAGALSPKHLRW